MKLKAWQHPAVTVALFMLLALVMLANSWIVDDAYITFRTVDNVVNAFVFTGNLLAAKYIGLRTSRRIEMYNGPIECRLLKFEMYVGSRKTKYQKL